MRALNPLEFKQLLDSDDSFIVLDSRDADEFADGHVPGALFIPFNEHFDKIPFPYTPLPLPTNREW